MSTKVYGCSDDLIEFEGDVDGEIGCYDDTMLVAFSDGTILSISYGKSLLGVWAIVVLRKGDLFDHLDVCMDEEADPYSDVVYFRDGALKAWCGKASEIVS